MFQRRATLVLLTAVLIAAGSAAFAGDGNRLTYLDEVNPWHPHKDFPKLTTPQWVGEKGVEAVVIFAIDDMRDPQKYEAYLRPILNRLKKIDGRAPVSIMSCDVKPDDRQLQSWLDEGLSIECHTVDHPCPLLAGGDFKKAKSTYDRCIDLMRQIPRNKPVAFRTPCCDSLNTVSPRFYAEIFNGTTPKGNFLQIDSSVFNYFTSADESIPRELVLDKDGKERFLKYLPRNLKRGEHTHDNFVNYIENYPYPYVIGNTCWQFPCVAPSDWSAQHLHGKNNPQTVADWKAALDVTVKKQGVFCLVFHPHGWIQAEQIVELIDHAEKTHGKKVKFLNFREAAERLTKNFVAEMPIRHKHGSENGVRILDVDHDGFQDVIVGNGKASLTRLWNPRTNVWHRINQGFNHGFTAMSLVIGEKKQVFSDRKTRYGVLRRNGIASCVAPSNWGAKLWHANQENWTSDNSVERFARLNALDAIGDSDLRDIDGDGICELIAPIGDKSREFYSWSSKEKRWTKLPFAFPDSLVSAKDSTLSDNSASLANAGLRFVDLNGDGRDDVVFSNHERCGVWLFKDMQSGWSVEVLNVKRSDRTAKEANIVLPPIVRKDGTNNGFFVHGRHLCWQNEDTDKLPDLIHRVSFDELLKNVDASKPGAKPKPKPDSSGNAKRPPPLSPDASLKAMQPRPGFRVELVAAEPLVRDPVAFEWGPDGRLWVAEMGDYPVGDSRGRIRVLTDTTGDGRYDKSTLFLDDLNFPSSVLPWKKGALITAAPDLLYAEDTNGDGKADVKKVLFTGFGQGNQQHRVNGLVLGLDNWIYCANGDGDGRVASTKTGKVVDIRGRDFRFNPESGELQTVTGRTQFVRSRDDWGNWFGNNNSNPMYHFVLSDRYLSRNPHLRPPDPRRHVSVKPGAAEVFPASKPLPRFNDYHTLNRFTSACSAIIYRDALFGPEFAGNSFVSEPVHNLVHREVVKPDGVTFTSRRADDEQTSEFLASRDNWFRPTMLKTGPDGALYIADMYRLVIEHPQYIPKELQAGWDFRAGDDRGRIYRMFPQDKKLRRTPRMDKMTPTQLVAALRDSNGWVRDAAQRQLIDRGDESAVPLLERTVAGAPRDRRDAESDRAAFARLHALCALDGLGRLKTSTLRTALSDPHPGVRRHAVRLAEPRWNESPELAVAAAKLASDPDSHVRMQLAYSLGEWDDAKSGDALATLLLKRGGDDPYLVAAALSSVHAKNLGSVVSAVLQFGGDAKQRKAVAGPLLSLTASMGDQATLLGVLDRLTRPVDLAQPLEKWTFQVEQIAALADFLDGLQSRERPLRAVIRSAGKGKAERLEVQTGRLFLFALQTAFSPRDAANVPDRLVGIRMLPYAAEFENNLGGMAEGCRELLTPQEDARIQAAAVAALARIDHANAPATLLKFWGSYTPSLRSDVADALLSREAWTRILLTAIQDAGVKPTDLSAAHRQRLLSLRNRELRDLAAKALKSVQAESNRKEVVAAYRPALQLSGNVANGKAIFKKTCSACHQLEGVGRNVGPDLTGLKDKSPEALLVAILDPNRNVESKYLNYVAATRDGRSVAGVLETEAGGSITLVGPDGKRQVLLRRELEHLRSTGQSAMPEGLEKELKPQDAADVLAYVRTAAPDKPARKPNAWFPRTISPGRDGVFTLAANACEVYGPTLKFEAKHRNLGWWGSRDDRAVWPIVVPAETTYDVEIEFACHRNTAGNTLLLKCGESTLSVKVPSTGTWDDYATRSVGSIKLPAGQQRLSIQSAADLKGHLIDLRSIRLKPRSGRK